VIFTGGDELDEAGNSNKLTECRGNEVGEAMPFDALDTRPLIQELSRGHQQQRRRSWLPPNLSRILQCLMQ